MVATPPPSKKEQLNKLLERGSVFVHLDPRRPGVAVPAWLTRKPQLVLQLGLNFPIPIRDLEIDEDGVRCTLSFNRAPFYCVLPWTAVYALVAEDGQVTVWPSELPSELVPQAEPAVRREGPRDRRGPKQSNRPRISVVPPPADSSADALPPVASLDDARRDEEARREEARREDEPPATTAVREDDERVADGSADEPARPKAPTRESGRPPRERPPYLRLVK